MFNIGIQMLCKQGPIHSKFQGVRTLPKTNKITQMILSVLRSAAEHQASVPY